MKEITSILKRSWQSHFWTNLATTGVLTLSFSLMLGAILFTSNLGRLFTVWGDEIQITVYLRDEITADQKNAVEQTIKSEKGIDSVQYIDKSSATSSFEKSLSSYGPSFLKSLKEDVDNPFPASFSIRVAKADKTPERIEQLAAQFGKLQGVEDVSYGQEWLKNYNMLLRISRGTSILFTFVLLIACLFAVSNSIQASLFSRREEIEILELVGATPKMIRKPYLIEGAFQGLAAVLASLICLSIIYHFGYSALEGIVGAATLLPIIGFLPFYVIFFSLFVGLGIGALGSYICVARLNTGWAASENIP